MTNPFSSARSDGRAEGAHPEEEHLVIRDKRRIDPTGDTPLPPPPDLESASGTPKPNPELEAVAAELEVAGKERDEFRAMAQRVQAEFANYRKRVDRDRELIGEQAAGRVVASLLPVLDDIDRAREHGDLDGAFKVVATQLESVLAKFGLEAFGEVGDEFDPAVHEAVMHSESDDVTVPTCTTVMRRGYKQGERLLRPAMVGVSDPSTPVVEATDVEAAGIVSTDAESVDPETAESVGE